MRHAGLEFEETLVRLYADDSTPHLKEHSPSGRVPVLYDGDFAVWDSLAIIEYLAERHPQAGIWPADATARARARSLAAEMHSGFAALRTHMPMNIRVHKPGKGMAEGVAGDIGRIQALWREARAGFGADGDFMFGAFSAADAMFAPVVMRFLTYGVAVDEIGAAYMDAVRDLPAMQEWVAAAEAEEWVIEEAEI
jgi:glutathione S-transferase